MAMVTKYAIGVPRYGSRLATLLKPLPCLVGIFARVDARRYVTVNLAVVRLAVLCFIRPALELELRFDVFGRRSDLNIY
jgi:hypothetical protein